MVDKSRPVYEFVDDTGEVFMAFIPSGGAGWVRVAGPDASEFVTKRGVRWVRGGGEWTKA